MEEGRPSYIVVVARGETSMWHGLEEGLDQWAIDRVEMQWDRRVAERRGASRAISENRRHGERRCAVELSALGFVIASRQEGRCTPCITVMAGSIGAT